MREVRSALRISCAAPVRGSYVLLRLPMQFQNEFLNSWNSNMKTNEESCQRPPPPGGGRRRRGGVVGHRLEPAL